MRLLGDMKKGRITLNAITYSAAISAYENRRQWQEALQLLSDTKKGRIIPMS